MGNLTLEQSGTDTRIVAPGQNLAIAILSGVQVDSLSESNFAFELA